jgi:hypothetical protein
MSDQTRWQYRTQSSCLEKGNALKRCRPIHVTAPPKYSTIGVNLAFLCLSVSGLLGGDTVTGGLDVDSRMRDA